jgi:uncharacterized protein (TIGR00369 family)
MATTGLYGGIASALIGSAGADAVVTNLTAGVPTIDLRIDWLKPARAGDLLGTRRVVKAGRRVSLADIEVHDAHGALVAVGRGRLASPVVQS